MNPQLESIFGHKSHGVTPREWALNSTHLFVRGQDHLSLYKDEAKGRRLTAVEAFDAYGLELLEEVLDCGSAILPISEDEPAATLRTRRESLGLSQEDVRKAAGVSRKVVEDCEDPSTRSPIRDLERIARVLGLDERKLSVEAGAGGELQLAVRLKTLGSAPRGLSPKVVTTLTEAAWVIRTQDRLQKLLHLARDVGARFQTSSNYGGAGYPAWQHGYFLAAQTREILGLDPLAPIESVRQLCETLGIALLQTSLPKPLAGATVVSAGVRGIVVNTEGPNQNVWVRRATIAHELGHLLWDPEPRLEMVKVDAYKEIEKLDRDRPDYVEARANAFAIEFLAPNQAVGPVFRAGGLRAVMERFGISHTAARHHTWNALDRLENLSQIQVDPIPTDDWSGRESFTDDFFPISSTPRLRRGVFSKLVVEAERRGLISVDTACSTLQASEDDYRANADAIAGLFSIDAP